MGCNSVSSCATQNTPATRQTTLVTSNDCSSGVVTDMAHHALHLRYMAYRQVETTALGVSTF
eukprot:m.1579122 g.1579122  ORF g.1579122 m.1579122 type:complete len:62 (-) comp25314_c0_seq12:8-193(-)